MTKKVINRILNRIKFSNNEWDELEKAFKDGWSKNEVCTHFNLKSVEYKILKKRFYGEL